jgi:hypothetical protein
MPVFVIAVLILFTRLLSAQSSPATPPRNQHSAIAHPEWPGAKPADVDTIAEIVRAFYSAISAPAGGKLDRDRLRSLFVPEGRIGSKFQAILRVQRTFDFFPRMNMRRSQMPRPPRQAFLTVVE